MANEKSQGETGEGVTPLAVVEPNEPTGAADLVEPTGAQVTAKPTLADLEAILASVKANESATDDELFDALRAVKAERAAIEAANKRAEADAAQAAFDLAMGPVNELAKTFRASAKEFAALVRDDVLALKVAGLTLTIDFTPDSPTVSARFTGEGVPSAPKSARAANGGGSTGGSRARVLYTDGSRNYTAQEAYEAFGPNFYGAEFGTHKPDSISWRVRDQLAKGVGLAHADGSPLYERPS